jgi:hypothetical protein
MRKPAQIPSELDDEQLSASFNLRAKTLFRVLLAIYAMLVVIYAFSGTSLYFTVINCLMLLIAGGLLFVTKDVIFYFLASHPAWIFSFTAYLYSAANVKPVEAGLFDAGRSITIAFVYQLACVAAFLLAFLVLGGRPQRQRVLGQRAMLVLQRFSEVFIVFGALAGALGVIIANPTASAITQDLQVFLWLGVGLHLRKHRGFKLDLVGILITGLFAGLAIYANNRTLMISAMLIVALGYLYYSRRLLNPQTIVLSYFALNFLLLFSSVTLDIRLSGGRESLNNSMLSMYAEKLLTTESLLAVVNPFASHSSTANLRNFADASYGHDFWLPYFGSNDSLGDRFVVLPMMDVVCGQFGEVNHTRWDALLNLVVASLPNFGQTKNLTYNDQLTWDLGLRDDDVIGKPMLTNACELYTMAGWTGVFLVTTIEFFFIFLLVAFLKKQLEFYILYLGTVAILILQLTVSTSSLGIAANVIRGLPLIVLVIWLIKQFALLSIRHGTKPALTQSL